MHEYRACHRFELKVCALHSAIIKYALDNRFLFSRADSHIALLYCNSQVSRTEALYAKLSTLTQHHINYLSENGLAERAQGIQFRHFSCDEISASIDLTPFEKRPTTPQAVIDFDPRAKNTLITTDPSIAFNRPEDIEKLLDIRLYPALRDLIKQNKVEAFLGTKEEMAAYYRSRGLAILFEFTIPSSAVYYLAENSAGEVMIIMAGLVSEENMIAQLLTLKLAGLQAEEVEIIGDVEHFTTRVENDFGELFQQLPELKEGSQALIIAGCGLEGAVSDLIGAHLQANMGQPHPFKGSIVSLIYTPLLHPKNGVYGLISLNLNYGEIVEKIVQRLLKSCACQHFFSGGAAGYIPQKADQARPPIGSRIPICRGLKEQEIVEIDSRASPVHLHVSSIF